VFVGGGVAPDARGVPVGRELQNLQHSYQSFFFFCSVPHGNEQREQRGSKTDVTKRLQT
jgi:hypothetical protein